MQRVWIALIIILLIFHFKGKAQTDYWDSIFKIADIRAEKKFEQKIKELTEANEVLKIMNDVQKDVFKVKSLTYSGMIDICFSRYISRRKIYNCISEIKIE